MFRIQGIIGRVNFPPVLRCVEVLLLRRALTALFRMSDGPRLRHQYQEVGLLGFGSKSFERCMERIAEFHYLTGLAMSLDTLEPWCPKVVDGQTELTFKTKYFTTGKDVDACENIPFDKLVDPNGVLGKLLKDGIKHGIENHVEYRALVIDSEDQTHRSVALH